jgi:hypothetical protein
MQVKQAAAVGQTQATSLTPLEPSTPLEPQGAGGTGSARLLAATWIYVP